MITRSKKSVLVVISSDNSNSGNVNYKSISTTTSSSEIANKRDTEKKIRKKPDTLESESDSGNQKFRTLSMVLEQNKKLKLAHSDDGIGKAGFGGKSMLNRKARKNTKSKKGKNSPSPTKLKQKKHNAKKDSVIDLDSRDVSNISTLADSKCQTNLESFILENDNIQRSNDNSISNLKGMPTNRKQEDKQVTADDDELKIFNKSLNQTDIQILRENIAESERNEDRENKNILVDPSIQEPFTNPKKKVAFAENLESPSSQFTTPLKSILKIKTRDIRSDHKKKDISPTDIEYWQTGNIPQYEPGSPKNLKLIDGCLHMLKDDKCVRKFEIFAAINFILQNNSFKFLEKKMTNPIIISSLVNSTKNVIIQWKESLKLNHIDPFKTRILNQCIKILTYIFNNFNSISKCKTEDISIILNSICDCLIKNESQITKATSSCCFALFRDQKLNKFQSMSLIQQRQFNDAINNSKKYFISTTLQEKMLKSVINIKNYNSVAIQIERTLALKNFVSEFPMMMNKLSESWIYTIINNILCFSKVKVHNNKLLYHTSMTLFEISKKYYQNQIFKTNFYYYLTQKVSNERMDALTSCTQGETVFAEFIKTLKLMVKSNLFEESSNIWMSISLLLNHDTKLQANLKLFDLLNWNYYKEWTSIINYFLENGDVPVGIKSWKIIVFNLSGHIRDSMKLSISEIEYLEACNFDYSKSVERFNNECFDKLETLIYPLIYISNNKIELSKVEIEEIVEFCIIVIDLIFNYLDFSNNLTGKFHSLLFKYLWDTLIDRIFKFLISYNFDPISLFFKIISNSIKSWTSALPNFIINMKSANRSTVNSVRTFHPRWILNNSESVIKTIDKLLKFNSDLSRKFEILNKFMQSIRTIIKKEKEVSSNSKYLQKIIYSYINEFIDSFPHNDDNYRYFFILNSEFINIFKAESLSNNEIIVKIFKMNKNEEDEATILRSLINNFDISKQLKIFENILKNGSGFKANVKTQQFIFVNLESRSYLNLTNNDFVTLGIILQNLDNLDIEKFIKVFYSQLNKNKNFLNIFRSLELFKLNEEAFIKLESTLYEFNLFSSITELLASRYTLNGSLNKERFIQLAIRTLQNGDYVRISNELINDVVKISFELRNNDENNAFMENKTTAKNMDLYCEKLCEYFNIKMPSKEDGMLIQAASTINTSTISSGSISIMSNNNSDTPNHMIEQSNKRRRQSIDDVIYEGGESTAASPWDKKQKRNDTENDAASENGVLELN